MRVTIFSKTCNISSNLEQIEKEQKGWFLNFC